MRPTGPGRPGSPLDELVGPGPAMQALRAQLRAVATLDSTVLLTGETGTGKGRVARVLHALSGRHERPFVHVDCAALSPTLIESELFGHERGAFTSAEGRRTGRFELAGDGTLFLDEIGDLAPTLQSKLLRVLDDRRFERIGGERTLRVRARIVAATSRDLRAAVRRGRFRPDLYYRLAVFHLKLPPLRRRLDDLPALVARGLDDAARRLGRARPVPSEAFLARLRAHAWPGNVRELLNVLERAAAAHPGGALQARHVEGLLEEPWGEVAPEADAVSLPALLDELARSERERLLGALRASGGNVSEAARRLGLPRGTLRHRLRRLGLSGETAEAGLALASAGAVPRAGEGAE